MHGPQPPLDGIKYLPDLYQCAQILYDVVLALYPNDKLWHCVASCRILSECPNAKAFDVYAGGILYEVFNPPPSFRDLANNYEGIDCARNGFRSCDCSARPGNCEACCRCKPLK